MNWKRVLNNAFKIGVKASPVPYTDKILGDNNDIQKEILKELKLLNYNSKIYYKHIIGKNYSYSDTSIDKLK